MAKKNTGGVMTINFTEIGRGGVKRVSIKRTATVYDALVETKHQDADIEEIRVNGREVKADTKLKANDYVVLLAQVSGGCR